MCEWVYECVCVKRTQIICGGNVCWYPDVIKGDRGLHVCGVDLQMWCVWCIPPPWVGDHSEKLDS